MTDSAKRTFLKWLAHRMRLPLRLFLMMFFDSKYLRGRHFDSNLVGYVWALSAVWHRNILRLAPPLSFPASFRTTISNSFNVDFQADDLNNFQSPGVYFQNFKGKIIIGRGCYIAPNVGLITANHDLENLDKHSEAKDVILGDDCWIGMNAVVLPGVVLGNGTIVGAGSVVTKSFPSGHCVIGGNPAKLIRTLGNRDAS